MLLVVKMKISTYFFQCSSNFVKQIEGALKDVQDMFIEYNKLKNNKNSK